jgi:hypothetical protein
MATRRVVTTEFGERDFYTVQTPIGGVLASKNMADVELVQFFLKRYFMAPHHIASTPPTRKGEKTILIDGIAGPQTRTAIKLFQKQQKAGGRIIATDGIINVPISNVAVNPTSTMWILNRWFMLFAPDKYEFDSLEDISDIKNYAYHLAPELNRKKA